MYGIGADKKDLRMLRIQGKALLNIQSHIVENATQDICERSDIALMSMIDWNETEYNKGAEVYVSMPIDQINSAPFVVSAANVLSSLVDITSMRVEPVGHDEWANRLMPLFHGNDPFDDPLGDWHGKNK